jgi:predicted DsbA family dithiol-disulfide isomerase
LFIGIFHRVFANALFAAQAGRCAREQKKFWAMRDWMGDHSQQLDLEHVVGEAISLRLDVEPFRYCLATAQYKGAVEKEAAEATGVLHLTGAPSFVIGKTAAIVDGEVVIGAPPYQAFEDKLNALLKLRCSRSSPPPGAGRYERN